MIGGFLALLAVTQSITDTDMPIHADA